MANILRFLEYSWQYNWKFGDMLTLNFCMSLTTSPMPFPLFPFSGPPFCIRVSSKRVPWPHIYLPYAISWFLPLRPFHVTLCWLLYPGTLAVPFSHWWPCQSSSYGFPSCASILKCQKAMIFSQDWFYCFGTFDNIWRHIWLSQLGWGCCWYSWVQAKG